MKRYNLIIGAGISVLLAVSSPLSSRAQVQTELSDSLKTILSAAEGGNAKAQNIVGTWYYNGTNVEQDYTKAKEWWQKSALQGNVYGIGNLGLCYQFGRGIQQDSLSAARLYTRAVRDGNELLLKERIALADKESIFDQMFVAQCFKEGIGTAKDLEKAMHYYAKAGNGGSVEAQLQLGVMLMNANDFTHAVKWLEKGSKNGDLVSTYYYGKFLLEGKGINQDVQEGVVLVLKAAEAGLPAAQLEAGNLYLNANGVMKNADLAASWFHKAALQGNVAAEWKLGDCYRTGTGFPKTFEKALFWYSEAASHGLRTKFLTACDETSDTRFDREFLDYVLVNKAYFVDKDYQTAFDLTKALVKAKVTDGKTLQAIVLANKNNPDGNVKKAIKLLKDNASIDPAAKFYLATLTEAGRGMKTPDINQAVSLYSASAAEGYAPAQCYLADMYYEGRNVPQDYVQAVNLYQQARAEKQLTENAAKRLAACFEDGKGGLQIDEKQAQELRSIEIKNNVLPLLNALSK